MGSGGQILFSTGGTHREYQEATVPDGAEDYFDAAWIDNVSRFVAVGAGGQIHVSNSTTGNTWTERPSPVSSTLRGVADFQGATRAVAVGDGGTIVRTASEELGGWVTVDSPTAANLWDVVRGNSVSIAVGEEGTILKGNLDGTSWEVVTLAPPLTRDLHGVSIEENGNFLAVGDSSLILRGLGSGSNWTVIAPPDTGVTMWDVVGGGIQIRPSVAVGEDRVWVSNDTGLTWDETVTTARGTLRGVAHAGNTHLACGDDGTILWSAQGFVWENVTAIRPTTWGRLKFDINKSR